MGFDNGKMKLIGTNEMHQTYTPHPCPIAGDSMGGMSSMGITRMLRDTALSCFLQVFGEWPSLTGSPGQSR